MPNLTYSTNLEAAKEMIIERANQLVSKLIDNRGHSKPPFSAEELARLVGVMNIEKTDLGKTSGLLIRFFKNPTIKINSSHNQARQNFSCAHEIGHILFSELKLEKFIKVVEHRTFNPSAEKKARSAIIENLCDIAATELLMPSSIFKNYLLDFGLSIESIEKLAKLFDVSIQAGAIRAAELSDFPVLVLKWQQQSSNKKPMILSWPKRVMIDDVVYTPVSSFVNPPSTLHNAYFGREVCKCQMAFKVGKEVQRLQVESKGFGRENTRYVLSIVTDIKGKKSGKEANVN